MQVFFLGGFVPIEAEFNSVRQVLLALLAHSLFCPSSHLNKMVDRGVPAPYLALANGLVDLIRHISS